MTTAYAALVSLLNNIDQIMSHPRLSTSLDKKQIESLHEKAGFLLEFIEGCDYGGMMGKKVQDLETRIASAAHAAEDVIESHIVDQILAPSSVVDQILVPSADDGETSSSFLLTVQKKLKNMKKNFQHLRRRITSSAHVAENEIGSHIVDQIQAGSNKASLECLFDLQKIIKDMDSVMEKAKEVKGLQKLGEEQPTHSRPPHMETGETGMVGFDDELIQLMDELTNQRSSRHIISIVGMGGAGKTTLARNVYENLLIKQHFDVRAWATIYQQLNVEEILLQLLSGIGKFSDRTVDELGEQLHKALSGRRYLIILDDAWSVEAWDELRHFFPDNGNRSRVVLTTRLLNVARDCHSSSCLTMKSLDEHLSWKLFCIKAFQQEDCPYPELEKVGKGIASLCRGLPLSTVVVGGLLLKSPRSIQFWENVATNIISNPDSKEKQESLDILSLSYNHLPPHLKPCFLYMGVFREDSEIRVSKIIKLWIAEGFLRPNNTQILEEVAEGYLKDLIDRNLILVSKLRGNGKIGSCGIHDLVRDLCLKVAQQQEFFHVTKGRTEGRLIDSHRSGLLHIGPSLARSILGTSTLRQPINHKFLRVWDGGYLTSPKELSKNVNLRYLCFLNPISELPSSISLVWNLQSLIIEYPWLDRVVVVAPIGIWKMRQLRHVKCTKIYVHDPLSDGLFVMDNLQTLTRAVNLRVSEEVCKIIPNIKKLQLYYHRRLQGYDESLFECLRNLDRLHKLESLKLIIPVNRWAELNEIVLRFPISLNKLSLSGCVLRWEDVSLIGSLPQLEVLELGVSSVMDEQEWSPIEGQFLRLKFLKIDSCLLINWNADNSHFPVLEKLHVYYLTELEEIPLGIGEIATLELIRVDYCSESAAISAVRIKEDQLENQGDDVLQIQLRMSHSEVESFKERVKTEGMTIDNIQLET